MEALFTEESLARCRLFRSEMMGHEPASETSFTNGSNTLFQPSDRPQTPGINTSTLHDAGEFFDDDDMPSV